MSAIHCQRGRFRAANVTQARADLLSLARAATRPGVRGERAEAKLPEAKARLASQREALAQHVAECAECISLRSRGMSRPLTGAAKTAQTRRVLLDEARAAIAERPRNPHTVVTLLERADALTPRKAPEPVTVVRNDRNMPGGVRVLPLVGPQAGWQ